jgi:curved DNA-binding protein CbpA
MTPEEARQILRVSSTATQDEIKQVWKDLAFSLHPDRAGGNEARSKRLEEKLKEVNVAYGILKSKKQTKQSKSQKQKAKTKHKPGKQKSTNQEQQERQKQEYREREKQREERRRKEDQSREAKWKQEDHKRSHDRENWTKEQQKKYKKAEEKQKRKYEEELRKYKQKLVEKTIQHFKKQGNKARFILTIITIFSIIIINPLNLGEQDESIIPPIVEIEIPEQPPIEQPEPPIEQPEPPIEQPEPPIEQPEPPIEQPEPPLEQPPVIIAPGQEPVLPINSKIYFGQDKDCNNYGREFVEVVPAHSGRSITSIEKHIVFFGSFDYNRCAKTLVVFDLTEFTNKEIELMKFSYTKLNLPVDNVCTNQDELWSGPEVRGDNQWNYPLTCLIPTASELRYSFSPTDCTLNDPQPLFNNTKADPQQWEPINGWMDPDGTKTIDIMEITNNGQISEQYLCLSFSVKNPSLESHGYVRIWALEKLEIMISSLT